MQRKSWILSSLALGGLFLVANVAQAAPTAAVWSITKGPSTLTLIQKLQVPAIGAAQTQIPQIPILGGSVDTGASTIAFYEGTISGIIDPGVAIQFTGANLAADLQTKFGSPVGLGPTPGGNPSGLAPANYGVFAPPNDPNFPLTGSSGAIIALRNFSMSFLSSAPQPIGGTGLFAAPAGAYIVSEVGSADVGGVPFPLNVGDLSTVPSDAAPAGSKWSVAGSVETIRVRFNVTYATDVGLALAPAYASPTNPTGQPNPYTGVFSTSTFQGDIFATRTLPVPEPATLALCGMGLVGLVPVGLRRLRNRG